MNTLLLVEDDQLLRELYTECLAETDISVITAEDGAIALDKLKNNHWDLVLLDMMLPKVNGYEILQKIAEDRTLKTYKKLVLMTNVEPDAQFKEALKMADGHIIKSEYTPDEFVDTVTRFLQKT